ncbi:MerR family transcriptional regulator [Paenibacillus sp. BR2-3]
MSRICGISIQTLRYYDNVGLVCPRRTDPLTHYRYYSNMDILLVKIVQDLKSLRFSLEEIERLQLTHTSIEN